MVGEEVFDDIFERCERSPAFIALNAKIEFPGANSLVDSVAGQTDDLRKFSDRQALAGVEGLAEKCGTREIEVSGGKICVCAHDRLLPVGRGD